MRNRLADYEAVEIFEDKTLLEDFIANCILTDKSSAWFIPEVVESTVPYKKGIKPNRQTQTSLPLE